MDQPYGKLYANLPQQDHQNTGMPYISGSLLLSASFGTNRSEKRFDFPRLPRKITVHNKGTGSVNVHFASITASANIIDNHSIPLEASSSIAFDVAAPYIFTTLRTSAINSFVVVTAEIPNNGILPGNSILTGSGISD